MGESTGDTVQAQTIFEINLQYIRGIWRIFWVLGHQVQVNRSMILKNTKQTTHSLYFTHFFPLR